MEYIILTNFIITIICYIIFWRKNSSQKKLYKVLLSLFLPFAGLIYIFASEKVRWKNRYDFASFIDENNTEKKTINLEAITHIDVQRQINIVPVEEALILNKSLIKRKILIDVIKNEPEKYINILKMAIKDEDTETSHYAAAAILEIKRLLRFNISVSETKMLEQKNMATMTKHIENIKKLVVSELLDAKSQKKFNELYKDILSEIVMQQAVPSIYLEEKINLELENANFEEAQKLCQKLELLFPNKEETFLARLRLCYEMNDLEGLNKTIDDLKNVSIDLSYKTSEVLRFWSVKAS